LQPAPYGLWQTEVQEFLVGEKPRRLALNVRPMSSHGFGDIVTLGTKKKMLKVLQHSGQAASAAEIYLRDRDATLHLERRLWLANCFFSRPKHCYIPSQRAQIALVVADLKCIRAG